MDYDPKPIEPKSARIPAELETLEEQLAERVHDAWAYQRLREGWKHGPERNERLKEHPCLVPYDKLSEVDKAYDRNTARATILTILDLGFSLSPPKGGVGGAPGSDRVEASYERARQWRRSGEALRCYDEVIKGLDRWPGDARLIQLKALALADMGVTEKANETIRGLVEQGRRDEESLSILARTYKDLWQRSMPEAAGRPHLEMAYRTYKECFDLTGGYYPGINAATLANLYGDVEAARSLASAVQKICRGKMSEGPDPGEVYYLTATLAEAALNLGDLVEAVSWYARAGEAGRGLYRDIHATRRNARLLVDHLGLDGGPIEAALFIPAVGVFVGHNIDRPGRIPPRFPDGFPALEKAIGREIREILQKRKIGFGFSSAAAGGDLIFLETLLDGGLEANIVLPYNKKVFAADNVAFAPGTHWPGLFERMIAKAEAEDRLTLASEWPVGEGPDVFDYANLVLFGLAGLKARHLDTNLVPIVLWDGKPGDGAGGTASAFDWWTSRGCEVERIDLEALKEQVGIRPETVIASAVKPTAAKKVKGESEPFPVATKAILFADVVNYSKMPEDLVPRFVREFMGGVAKLLERAPRRPEFKNTWGDAVYFVFDQVRDAGLIALDLIDLVSKTDWQSKGLPGNLNLRIALHAGPVHSCRDPVTEIDTFTGTHVSRAARIEPITPPGNVFASQGFAALAAAERIEEFTCDYVGRMVLAKGYGTFSTYHVRRGRR